MSRLRVLRIIARMNVGGPAVQVSGLMRGLPPERFDHRLLTGWCASDEADYLATQAPDVVATRVPGLGRAVRAGDDARAFAALISEVKSFRPHIVHTHTAKAGTLGRVATLAAGTGSAVVHTFHGHLLHGYFSPAKTGAVVALERGLAGLSDRLVAVGPEVRDDLLGAGIGRPDQYVVIPPGLVLPDPPPRAGARSALGLPSEGPVIAFIGRLTRIKRPDRFADMVQHVASKRPDITFAVAGDGDQADLLRRRVELEHLPVRLLGWQDDVSVVLAASDAVVLTSDNEGTPLSLIQAAMAGLPVVASDVGSVAWVVVDGETGWLTPPTSQDLARALLDLLADPDEARRRGVAAQVRAKELYGVDRLVRDHAELYEEIARAKRR